MSRSQLGKVAGVGGTLQARWDGEHQCVQGQRMSTAPSRNRKDLENHVQMFGPAVGLLKCFMREISSFPFDNRGITSCVKPGLWEQELGKQEAGDQLDGCSNNLSKTDLDQEAAVVKERRRTMRDLLKKYQCSTGKGPWKSCFPNFLMQKSKPKAQRKEGSCSRVS